MATTRTMTSARMRRRNGVAAVTPMTMIAISATNAPTMKMSPWAKLIMPMIP